MTAAQAMIERVPVPPRHKLIAFIDRHPADDNGPGFAVLRSHVTGIEVAWDGHRIRSLPRTWRETVTVTPA